MLWFPLLPFYSPFQINMGFEIFRNIHNHRLQSLIALGLYRNDLHLGSGRGCTNRIIKCGNCKQGLLVKYFIGECGPVFAQIINSIITSFFLYLIKNNKSKQRHSEAIRTTCNQILLGICSSPSTDQVVPKGCLRFITMFTTA
jgi:hypothetical protein